MRLTCMLTVSETYAYLGGFIHTYRDIIFWNGDFFLRFCLPFTHKRRFCATKTLVLGLVHMYPDIFENREIYLRVSKKICKCASTPNVYVFESFVSTRHENAKHLCSIEAVFCNDTYHPKTCQCIHQICNYRLGRWLQWDPFHHSYCGMLMTPNHLS